MNIIIYSKHFQNQQLLSSRNFATKWLGLNIHFHNSNQQSHNCLNTLGIANSLSYGTTLWDDHSHRHIKVCFRCFGALTSTLQSSTVTQPTPSHLIELSLLFWRSNNSTQAWHCRSLMALQRTLHMQHPRPLMKCEPTTTGLGWHPSNSCAADQIQKESHFP